ncbi:C-type lectin domain family 4 member M-like [Haplochromis burtoni]|uniref:C-type lectin domain family 4 member M-like n=1 Tax=Haplochromis burtoni TaxID=8153 RepID=UPI001C2DC4AC|nr:C-type lectin domain family 4 member M-like [Haplochromis burtoni]
MSEEVQRLKAEKQQLNKTYEYTTAIPTVTMWNTTSDITVHNSSISWMWMSHYRRRRQLEPCQRGWLQFKSSCYVTSNHDSLDQKTWEGARDDCRGRNSELVVIESPEEQDFVYSSLIRLGASDYWTGLRVKSGSWNWVDGRNLTKHYWIQPPADNEGCVISVRGTSGWKAVSCDIKNSWICEQGALSG